VRRVAVVAIALVVACGPAVAPAGIGVSHHSSDAGIDAPSDAAADVVETWPSLESIATRAGPAARGMREVARTELSTDAGRMSAEIARADTRDLCARVAYGAPDAVTARIEDATSVLAERSGETEGMLGARGPVCVKRGGVLRVTFEGAARVRFVAWIAP
jgi:hypothetical protein